MVSPADQREVVSLLSNDEGCNISRACAMAGLSRSTFRYKHKQRTTGGWKNTSLP
ncbi:MAG: helix-turn-helix domain-containing protein [Chitinophagaceae bacterium]|nr:MAG: helix-turn-helix domain-containing protein [Chitinophagaceae bacterium]